MLKNIFLGCYKILLIPHLFLYQFSKNKNLINEDIDRWAKEKKLKNNRVSLLLRFLALSPDFRTIFYFRNRGVAVHILNLYCKKERNFRIDVNTKLGGGILTGHPYCTILNANSIGKNFYVNHLVTIGEIEGKKPTIGDNVSINTGAIVIGDIKIGDNSIIGAGSVVVKNVPENAVVVGNPGKIIKRNGVRV